MKAKELLFGEKTYILLSPILKINQPETIPMSICQATSPNTSCSGHDTKVAMLARFQVADVAKWTNPPMVIAVFKVVLPVLVLNKIQVRENVIMASRIATGRGLKSAIFWTALPKPAVFQSKKSAATSP